MNLNVQSSQNLFLAQREKGTLGLTEEGVSHFDNIADNLPRQLLIEQKTLNYYLTDE